MISTKIASDPPYDWKVMYDDDDFCDYVAHAIESVGAISRRADWHYMIDVHYVYPTKQNEENDNFEPFYSASFRIRDKHYDPHGEDPGFIQFASWFMKDITRLMEEYLGFHSTSVDVWVHTTDRKPELALTWHLPQTPYKELTRRW